jgi:putative endonuclease
MTEYFIYVLQSLKDKRFYIGSTACLQERLLKHNSGGVDATKYRRPLEIVYTESFPEKSAALLREKYLKSLKSHKAVKEIIDRRHGSSGGRAPR